MKVIKLSSGKFAWAVILAFCVFMVTSIGQTTQAKNTEGDLCHVYVVDVALGERLKELFLKSENPESDEKLLNLKKETEINFPKFETKIGEEELTTAHFPFPKSKMIITASVFYTDESLGSSMIMGISVTNKKENYSIGYPPLNSSITEVYYNDKTSIVRTKQYVKVLGKMYLVGLECDCSSKRKNKESK
jgi:hypothetical protein